MFVFPAKRPGTKGSNAASIRILERCGFSLQVGAADAHEVRIYRLEL